LELCIQAKEWDALELSLPQYLYETVPGRRGLLFAWSVLLGFRDEFYRYLSYDQAEDRESVLDEVQASTMDRLARNKVVSEIRTTLKREVKAHHGDAIAFLKANEKALFHALKPWNNSVQTLVRFFLKKTDRSAEEEVFFLMAIRQLTEN
jgi:hypothetical protein